MKILAVLQNPWFKDPARIRQMLDDHKNPEDREAFRRRLIGFALFRGCKTGRILKQVFGEGLCEEIIWEEASLEIGGISTACFPADRDHLAKRLAEEVPDLVIAFGKVARAGLEGLFPQEKLLFAPHPAARGPKVRDELEAIRRKLP